MKRRERKGKGATLGSVLPVRADRFSRLLCPLLALASLWLVSSCKEEKKPDPDSRSTRCSDFADEVGGAYQRHLAARGKEGAESQALERAKKRVAHLRDQLRSGCTEGRIPKDQIQCVFKASPKTYSELSKCLDEEELPMEVLEEEELEPL